jgi:hypothetical protein
MYSDSNVPVCGTAFKVSDCAGMQLRIAAMCCPRFFRPDVFFARGTSFWSFSHPFEFCTRTITRMSWRRAGRTGTRWSAGLVRGPDAGVFCCWDSRFVGQAFLVGAFRGAKGTAPFLLIQKSGQSPAGGSARKTPQELGYQPMGTSRHEPHWPRPGPLGRSRADVRTTVAPVRFIASDIANGWHLTANTAVPAEFAGTLAAERFLGNVGRNRVLF